jgi:hypothetical protein
VALHPSGQGGILAQREVSPGSVVIVDIALDDPAKFPQPRAAAATMARACGAIGGTGIGLRGPLARPAVFRGSELAGPERPSRNAAGRDGARSGMWGAPSGGRAPSRRGEGAALGAAGALRQPLRIPRAWEPRSPLQRATRRRRPQQQKPTNEVFSRDESRARSDWELIEIESRFDRRLGLRVVGTVGRGVGTDVGTPLTTG